MKTTRTASDAEQTTTASDIAEMMKVWDKITAAAKREFARASDEERYQIAKGAMNHALGIGK